MVRIPWFTRCVPVGWMVCAATFILQREYRSLPELTENSSRSLGLTTDGELESFGKILSMEVFNSLLSLKFGVIVCPIFTILPFRIQTEGEVGLVHIATSLVPLPLVSGVEPLTPVLLTL